MSCCGSLFVNLGGGGGTGMLQIAGGVPLDSTLRFVEDQNGTDSRLQLSTTEVGFEQSSAGYINRWYNSGGTANARKYAVYVDANYWSLTTRNDAENSGEQFLIATALASNLSTLQLGKSGSPLILSTQLATLASSNLVLGTTSASARLHVRGSGTSSGTTALLVQNNAANPSLQVDDNQLIQGFNGSTVRFKLGFNSTTGQSISTRDGEFSVGLIDASQSAAIRFLTLGTGSTYIDGYTEGSTKALNYPLFIGSRGSNNSVNTTNSTTQENGTQTVFGYAVNEASSLVTINSTTRGFLPPRMTTTDRGNISSPATGLKLYNTTTNNTDTFDGTNWQSFGKETKITGSLEVNIASGKVINAIEVSSAMGLGFYNAAAIIQPVTGGSSATYASVSGTEIKENDTFDGYTVGGVVKALRNLGLLA
jgi:hypothetical protein